MIKIKNYIDSDSLAIAIRKAGGSAWVEIDCGREVVFTNRSLNWVRKICRKIGWIIP